MAHVSARRSRAYAAPVRRRRRFRLRRLMVSLVLLMLLAVGVRAYILQVYAPGLTAEARAVPALVDAQLSGRASPYVPLSAISPSLRQAIVAIEDRRFYSHNGIDPLGLIRAAFINLTNQHIDQGGSTLEEQLVKRVLVGDDSTLHNKLRTMALAWAVDQDFSKSHVLELYLNAAYYGQGAYGVGAAAHIYFGTDTAHLTLPQAAFLAALPQAPSIYGAHPTSPVVKARQLTVLQDMEEQGDITAAQESAAAAAPLSFAFPNP